MVSSEEANWNAVVSGQAVCTPELTSYGFAVLTEGRMISACTDTGTILWQRAVPGRPDPFLTVLDGDFLLTVNDGHTLSFTNPSGLTLWSSIVPFSIISAPYKGRDGRVFVRGRKDIACYSIKGICKWHLSTEQQSLLPLTELPDGSLVVFLMQPAGDKTAAVRISPFGEILEQITFAGIVTSTASCSDGLLLTFSGGGAGLCSIQNNDVRSVWALPSDNSIFSGAAKNDNTFFLASGSSRAVLVQPLSENAKITLFNTGSGTVLSTLIVPNININKTVYKAVSENNYLIADDNHAVLISDSGDCRWSALLPQKNSSSTSWNYLTYTANGFLVLCRTSWAVTGYRMIQNFPSTYNFENTIKKKDYSTFIQSDNQNNISFKIWSITGDLGSGLTGDGRRRELLNGMYGINEIKWTKELFDAGHAYLYFLHNSNSGGRTKPSVFSTDITGTDRMLSQLSLYGTDTFQPLIAQLINYEKNRTLMHTLIETAGSCGYDPDDKLLNSLDNALFSISARDDVLLFSLCDAVYSICRFMGRPAFYKHGREILSKMLYPQYDNRVHVYARKTLTNISGLKL
ncbi:MAG: PQQ-binding-like beta-propeller repeat protein [Treponema sp.]|nr:PQQ-binding-like beta-propeller repeat protein [Treponema sp.]